MLRSLTVQERIRELNLRARMFTDTMLAIQGSSRLSHPRRVVTKSLQVSSIQASFVTCHEMDSSMRQVHKVTSENRIRQILSDFVFEAFRRPAKVFVWESGDSWAWYFKLQGIL